jgi:hypothetical protein
MHTESTFETFLQEIEMQTYKIRTANGTREWQADDKEHAVEQHDNAFKTDGRYHDGERIEDVAPASATQPQFKPGDRFWTHYDYKWGTVVSLNTTYRDQTHGVTGDKLPDTTWYDVKYDDGGTSLLDDAHGNWDMARMVPPHIAKRYGYGDDPKGGK